MTAEHHLFPHTDKLDGRSTKARHKTFAMICFVWIFTACDKGGVLINTSSVHFLIQKRDRSLMEILKKRLIHAVSDQFQQILVFHMEPDGFILQPARCESSRPAKFKGCILQRGVDFIHGKLLIIEITVPHLFI